MVEDIKSNSIVFAGPFIGEFGWELSHWMPHVRWLRNKYKGKQLIVSSYPGREPLYNGIVDGFWPLPDWFVSEKHDCDCFEALSEYDHYGKLILHFKAELSKRYKIENVLWTKPPRGFNHILRKMNQVEFKKLEAFSEAENTAGELIAEHGGKPVIVLFAREVKRNMFLDINSGKNCWVEDVYPGGLPTRNWPRSHWEDLFEMVHARFGKQFTIAIGGTKGGNCLLNAAQKHNDVIDLTAYDINKSLDVTIALLNRAFMSISSQSGPTHLSVQCGCPSFVYGHEEERHTQTDNPLKTDVVFFSTQLGLYNDPPEQLFKEIAVYIELLKQENEAIQISPTNSNIFVNAKGEAFEYSPESYAEKSEDWIKNVSSTKELLDKWDDDWHQSYVYRWNRWFSNIEINGIILDIGFQNGKTLYALSQKYPFLKIDALDFNPALSNAIPLYKELMPNLNDIWIGDSQKVDKPNGHYDAIHCIDFFEHLPPLVYKQTIKECHRLLKLNGRMFIYVGKTDAAAHIHLISNEDVIKDMEDAGFRLGDGLGELLIFEKHVETVTKKIKKIGIVGVFDNPDSTNIPFAKAFANAGYAVDTFNYRTVAKEIGPTLMNQEIVRFAPNYDLIIICKGNGIYSSTIAKCKVKTTVCWYMMDAQSHLDADGTYYAMSAASSLSVAVAGEVASVLAYSGAKNVHHIIQGVDPKRFRHIDCEKLHDIVFVGQSTQKRRKVLIDLKADGFTGKTYGTGFFNGHAYGEDFNKACSEARILLAINNTDPDQDSFSDRILRYMATGGCVVTEYSKGLEKYFVNGKHLAWPIAEQTLSEVIRYYLDHPKMMNQMAKTGYEYVLENHTWDSVAGKIIKIVEGL